MLTAKDQLTDKVNGLNAGAGDYLVKPFAFVLTKDQIINHVWGYDADVLPNTVEAYMG